MNIYRFCVKSKEGLHFQIPKNEELLKQAHVLGFKAVKEINTEALYFVRGNLSNEEKKVLADFLFCDELYEYSQTEAYLYR